MGGDPFGEPGFFICESFNPRPRMGGDQSNYHIPLCFVCFNPRPRMGGDPIDSYAAILSKVVSIHAPAWGATPISYFTCKFITVFQSTPPHGGRPYLQL